MVKFSRSMSRLNIYFYTHNMKKVKKKCNGIVSNVPLFHEINVDENESKNVLTRFIYFLRNNKYNRLRCDVS